MRRLRRALAVCLVMMSSVVLLVPVGFAAAATNPPKTPIKVVFWGDSLATESAPYVNLFLAGTGHATVNMRNFPGTALCDWYSDMRQIAPTHPTVAVFEFSGNNMTPCTFGSHGEHLQGDALAKKYSDTVTQVEQLFRKVSPGTRTLWVGAPPFPPTSTQTVINSNKILAVYKAVPSHWANSQFVDAGLQVAGPNRSYTATVPCGSWEHAAQGCVKGRIVVRAPDKAHFCPVKSQWPKPCQVYSAGAFRYAAGITGPIVAQYHL